MLIFNQVKLQNAAFGQSTYDFYEVLIALLVLDLSAAKHQ